MKRPPRAALILRNGALLAFVVATCHYLSLPEGVFLALGVLTVLESDLGGGVIAGRERFIGTLMGLVAVVISSGALVAAPQAIQVCVGLTLARIFGFAAGLTSGYIVGGASGCRQPPPPQLKLVVLRLLANHHDPPGGHARHLDLAPDLQRTNPHSMAGAVQQLAERAGPGVRQAQHLTRWSPGFPEPAESSQ